jgi:hypothetical protein
MHKDGIEGTPDLLDRVCGDDTDGEDDDEDDVGSFGDISEVNSDVGSTLSVGFDWETLEDDGGHQIEEVHIPVLRRLLPVFSKGIATEWLVARGQARTDHVPNIMLEMEMELHLLVTPLFDI